MKKTVILLIITTFLISCGPRRAKCYGYRCEVSSDKKEIATP